MIIGIEMNTGIEEKDKETIEALRLEPSRTKPNMKALNRIYDKYTGKNYMHCLCSKEEREDYHTKFYKWYDSRKV